MYEPLIFLILLINTAILCIVMKTVHSNNQEHISAQIKEISSSLELIKDKSNIVALNATIEASNIGKQGSGFIKVIEEMKLLAEEAGIITDRINSLK